MLNARYFVGRAGDNYFGLKQSAEAALGLARDLRELASQVESGAAVVTEMATSERVAIKDFPVSTLSLSYSLVKVHPHA